MKKGRRETQEGRKSSNPDRDKDYSIPRKRQENPSVILTSKRTPLDTTRHHPEKNAPKVTAYAGPDLRLLPNMQPGTEEDVRH